MLQVQPPLLSHFHLYFTWAQVYEAQLSVDDNMKKLWEAAKDEKERTGVLLATSISALGELSNIIDESMGELARLAEEYASLSFSGFSAPLEKAIWLLEQQCRGMEEKGVGLELLTKVRSNLEHMKARLDLLRKATDKVRKGFGEMREGCRTEFGRLRLRRTCLGQFGRSRRKYRKED